MKAYFVTWTRQGFTSKMFESHNPDDCKEYAKNNIVHGHITERIQIHDLTGPLETVYAKNWNQE